MADPKAPQCSEQTCTSEPACPGPNPSSPLCGRTPLVRSLASSWSSFPHLHTRAVTVPLPLGYSSNVRKRQFSIEVKNVASGAKLPGFKSFDKILFSWSLSLLCCQVRIQSRHHFEHLLEIGGCGGAACCVCSRVSDTSVMTVAASQGSADRANEKAPWPWPWEHVALPHAGCGAKSSIVTASSNAHRHPAKWALLLWLDRGLGHGRIQ